MHACLLFPPLMHFCSFMGSTRNMAESFGLHLPPKLKRTLHARADLACGELCHRYAALLQSADAAHLYLGLGMLALKQVFIRRCFFRLRINEWWPMMYLAAPMYGSNVTALRSIHGRCEAACHCGDASLSRGILCLIVAHGRPSAKHAHTHSLARHDFLFPWP
jgi:hypothetical protein